jgi:hypothetical protein
LESDDSNIKNTTTTTTTTFTDVEEAAHRAGQRNSASPPAESPDEVPHARGPALLGVEDMGLQDGKGVEMDLGDQNAQRTTGDGAQDAQASTSTEAAQVTNVTDGDGDIVLDDSLPKEQIGKIEDSTEKPQKEPEAADPTQASESDKKD